MAERLSMSAEQEIADLFNRDNPLGTRVRYWPGVRSGAGRLSFTRTPAWLIGARACVTVDGYPGGIALTHVEVLPEACDCPAAAGECPHCGRQERQDHKDRCHRAAIGSE